MSASAGAAARLVRQDGAPWRLEGALTKDTVPALHAEPLEGVAGHAVLDLTAVSQFDSTALALLLAWSRRLREQGATLELRGVSPQLQEVAKVCGVAGLLGLSPPRDVSGEQHP